MTDLINMNDKYIYRKGDDARVLCVDAVGEYPVISLTTCGVIMRHKSNGFWLPNCKESARDLIKVEPVVESYLPVFKDAGSTSLEEVKRYWGDDAGVIGFYKVSTQNGKLIKVEIVE